MSTMIVNVWMKGSAKEAVTTARLKSFFRCSLIEGKVMSQTHQFQLDNINDHMMINDSTNKTLIILLANRFCEGIL